MSKTFKEFVSHKDGVIHHLGDVTELLQRIATEHGARLRQLVQSAISSGEIDDDKEFRDDLRELSKALSSSSSQDQFPVKEPRGKSDPDVVTRPRADGGGGGPMGQGGEGGGGD